MSVGHLAVHAVRTHVAPVLKSKTQGHTMDTVFLGLVGAAMVFTRDLVHEFSIPAETIVLVIFLAGLMGITRLPLPTTWRGHAIPLAWYPPLCGVVSGFMDSFLVLLLLKAAVLHGSRDEQVRFTVYCMLAALIGGLITYFGEVYMLPLALTYNMRAWHSMLPIVVPVAGFLALLAWLASRLEISVVGVGRSWEDMNGSANAAPHGHAPAPAGIRSVGGSWLDYAEFAAFIVLLLVTHNALLCLGLLLLYASVSGQGKQLTHVVLMEMEVAVMLLLVLALLIAEPAAPLMAHFTGWLAFIPATINAVLTGAIFPASGDVWRDVHVLSTAALLTPVSSLVGVMLFPSLREWRAYIKIAVPLAAVWFVLYAAWFWGPWQLVEPAFEAQFGAPELSTAITETY